MASVRFTTCFEDCTTGSTKIQYMSDSTLIRAFRKDPDLTAFRRAGFFLAFLAYWFLSTGKVRMEYYERWHACLAMAKACSLRILETSRG